MRTEHHIWWIESEVVELTKRSKVVDRVFSRASWADGTDPADGSRYHASL